MALCSRLFKNGISSSTIRVMGLRPFSTSIQLQKVNESETFFEKNDRLKRPMSPHLTIYKPQVTSMLSLSHRGCGIMLSTMMSGFGIGMLVLPGSFPHYISMIDQMHFGVGLIFFAKLAISFPFIFHTMNGVRHLLWDLGIGFGLRELYKSGYFVLSTSFVMATILSMF